MDLYKNNASGKYFIHLEDAEKGMALFVTPNGDLKILEINLFENQGFMDEADWLKRDLITPIQLNQYYEYMNG